MGTGYRGKSSTALAGVLAVLSAGLLAFSQTVAWFWDEGFHLLTAQLINAGKRPYLDFFYQHPPLYAWLVGLWMRVAGESWRSAHTLSTLATLAGIALVMQFVWSRLPDLAWRQAAAIVAGLAVGLHFLVIRFGTIGMPFGLCILFLMAAFRSVVAAVDRETSMLPAWAGLFAGAAAASSLLSAPAWLILLVWILRRNRAGSRWSKCWKYLGGTVAAFLPLLWLAAQSPRAVIFHVFEYHLLHRRPTRLEWPDVRHDLKVITGWLDSSQTLLLVLLAAVGVMLVTERGNWSAPRRAEFSLCLWLIGGLALLAASASPTFDQYFILPLPFLAILASVGFYGLGSTLWAPRRPAWLVLAVMGLFTLGASKAAFHHRRLFVFNWRIYDQVAREVNRVTPAEGLVYADPLTYFLTRRRPPSGLENNYSRDLAVPASLADPEKYASSSTIDGWLSAGRFATVVLWDDAPRAEELGLPRLYANRGKVDQFDFFWDRVAGRGAGP